MPEIKYYEVEQTRTVKVWANDEVAAAQLAAHMFFTNQGVEHVNQPNVAGAVLGNITITNVNISREQ